MGKSEKLGLKYVVTKKAENGRPLELAFEDGIVYDRKEMDILNKADDETVKYIHFLKSQTQMILHKIEEAVEK